MASALWMKNRRLLVPLLCSVAFILVVFGRVKPHHTTTLHVDEGHGSHMNRLLLGRNTTTVRSTTTYIDNYIMQYKVRADLNAKDMMEKSYIPDEFNYGDASLKTRTYPATPRKPTCNRCFPYAYRNMLRPKSCEGPVPIRLLLLVTTIPLARAKRDAIRKTWLSLSYNNTGSVRYMFLIGAGWPAPQQALLVKEQQQYHDILQDDYIDTYFNLSIKVLSGFKHSLDSCHQAQFVMRTADDNYVNIPNVLKLLHGEKRVKDHMVGRCKLKGCEAERRARSKYSKWAVTYNEWPLPRYPPYCVGTTFFMSRATTEKIFRASENVPYFVMEDVYFGEVARQSNIPLLNFDNFLIEMRERKLCPHQTEWRAIHDVTATQQFRLWRYCQTKVLPP